MEFEKQQAIVAAEASISAEPEEVQRLDLTSVCPDRATAENFSPSRGERKIDVAALLEQNDKIVALANASWDSVMTKFNRLPDEFKKQLLMELSDSMTSDEKKYPGYCRFYAKNSNMLPADSVMV